MTTGLVFGTSFVSRYLKSVYTGPPKSNVQNIVSYGTMAFMFSNFTGISILLPTGSEERGVLGVGSIPVAILTSCQDMKTIAI